MERGGEEKPMRGRDLVIGFGLGVLVIVAVIMTILNRSEQAPSTADQCPEEVKEVTKLEVGSCAPNFRLPDLHGQEKELYADNQKPTFVNFWATWCGPCQSELPLIESAYRKYKDKVNFMLVNATSTEPNSSDVMKYMKKNQYTFPVVLDHRDTNITFGKYKLVGIPVTLVVDPQGRILFMRVGQIREKEIERLMKRLADE